MSMTSEQVKKIRSVAGICTIKVKKTLLEAADTIEALSAKLQVANMENGGGWIPCEDRLPNKDGFYLATIDGEIVGEDKPFSGLAEFENGKWVDDEDDYQCILAWQPLPEPYRP